LAVVVILTAILTTPAAAETKVFPAVADKAGMYGSHWQTDVRVMSTECLPPDFHVGFPVCQFDVTVQFRAFTGEFFSTTVNLIYFPGNGAQYGYDNILRLFPGASGLSGVLILEADSAFVAYVRTYSTDGENTFGHWVPEAYPLENGIVYGIPYTVDRTNIMVLNLGMASTITIDGEILIIEASSAAEYLGVNPGTLCAGCDGLNPPVVGFGEPLIYAIVTTIDNETNDATVVPLWPQ
jgi:hypothetical protein